MFRRSFLKRPKARKTYLSQIPQEIEAFLHTHFDAQWYLQQNPDVAAASLDPLLHFLSYGLSEGRRPSANIYQSKAATPAGAAPIRTFEFGNEVYQFYRLEGPSQKTLNAPNVNPQSALFALQTELGISNDFVEFVERYFDPAWYLQVNGDVAAAKIDPLEHFLRHGLAEGRRLSEIVSHSQSPVANRIVRGEFRVGNRTYWFYEQPILPRGVLKQVVAQGAHDPAILAPGVNAIKGLRQFLADDLESRDGLNVEAIFSAFSPPPDTVFLLYSMCIGGAEKYAASIFSYLTSELDSNAIAIVTEVTQKNVANWERIPILKPFAEKRVVFWRDIAGPGWHSTSALARLINSIKPKRIIVINSALGLKMISEYGRAMSNYSSIYCTYFGLSNHALGAPYGVRYARSTAPYATLLTDNHLTERVLKQRYGLLPGPGVRVLPPLAVGDEKRHENSRNNRERTASRSADDDVKRWLWISRVEPFKGTQILSYLAQTKPEHVFEVFGPLSMPLEDMGLQQPNIRYMGIMSDLRELPLQNYKGFVFTSLFEGFPNIVLEVALMGVPLILSDVGGLKDTFVEGSAILVTHQESHERTADSSGDAMDMLCQKSTQDIELMIDLAFKCVCERHSAAAFSAAAREIFV